MVLLLRLGAVFNFSRFQVYYSPALGQPKKNRLAKAPFSWMSFENGVPIKKIWLGSTGAQLKTPEGLTVSHGTSTVTFLKQLREAVVLVSLMKGMWPLEKYSKQCYYNEVPIQAVIYLLHCHHLRVVKHYQGSHHLL